MSATHHCTFGGSIILPFLFIIHFILVNIVSQSSAEPIQPTLKTIQYLKNQKHN